MTIKNNTVYTFDALYSFNKNFLKSRKSTWIVHLVSTVIMLLSFALHLFTELTYGDGKLDAIMVYLLLLIAVIDVYSVLACTVLLKARIKKSPQLNTTVETVFSEESFTENSVTTNMESRTVVSYEQVLKLTEDEKYLYLYIARNAAVILDKNGFADEGDLDYLISLLRIKLPSKKIKL